MRQETNNFLIPAMLRGCDFHTKDADRGIRRRRGIVFAPPRRNGPAISGSIKPGGRAAESINTRYRPAAGILMEGSHAD